MNAWKTSLKKEVDTSAFVHFKWNGQHSNLLPWDVGAYDIHVCILDLEYTYTVQWSMLVLFNDQCLYEFFTGA